MDTTGLTRTFVELADTLVEDFDVHELLHRLADRCTELLPVDAVGMLLADGDGELHVALASSESTRAVEVVQLQTSEGPCLQSFRDGEQVVVPDLTATTGQWPHFAAAALEAGHRAAHALPLRLRGTTLGAMNLFQGDDTAPLDKEEVDVAQAMADVATIAVLQHRLARKHQLVAEQLQGALTSRIAIEQAKGVLAARMGISMEEAFARLRKRARSTQTSLSQVASDVVRAGRLLE